jgi:hypothetical protein
MDVNRLRFGEMIAAAAAALLFLVMWLPWYGAENVTPSFTANAWESYSWVDLLLFLTIIVAIGLAVLTMTQRTVALPVSASVLVTALGGLCALIVLLRIVNQPGDNDFVDVRYGAYLGFLLCVGIAFGGYMSMRDEGASFGSAGKRIQAGMAAASATPQRPAPPAAPPQPQQPPTPGQPFQPQQQPGQPSAPPAQPFPPQPPQPQQPPQAPPAQPGVPPHGDPPAGQETRVQPQPGQAPPPEDPPPGSSS